MKILVVDDEPQHVTEICNELNELSLKYKDSSEIIKAYTVINALEETKRKAIDAIILDYNFEYGMNGDKIIELIDDPFNTILFVLISGFDEKKLNNVLDEISFKHKKQIIFIRKPYSILELKNAYLTIKRFVTNRSFPFPLSDLYERYQNESGQQKFFTLISFIETFLKFSLIILIKDLERSEIISKQNLIKEFGKHIDFNKPTSFGSWILLNKIAIENYCSKFSGKFMPEIIDFFKGNFTEITSFEFLYKFKGLRDQLFHSIMPDDNWFDLLLEDEKENISTFLEKITFFANFPAFIPQGILNIDKLTNEIEYDTRVMINERKFKKIKLKTKSHLNMEMVYLFSKYDNPMSLFPFISLDNCKTCRYKTIYVINSLSISQSISLPICQHSNTEKTIKYSWESKKICFPSI